MNIGLFGGSFDPIHSGHIKAAQAAKDKAGLDKIIFLPSGKSPHKALCASPTDRFNMTKEAVDGMPGFFVSDFETKKETKCYSAETVAEFKKLYPDDELYFIIGDDEYASFDEWYKSDELIKMCRFLVITRHGEDIRPPFIGVDMPKIPISSSMIRELVKNGGDISPFVKKSTACYIKEHKLYR